MKLRLKEILEKQGRKISWVAKKMNVDKRSLYYWMKGETRPTYDKVAELAELLDVTLDELIDNERDDS